MNNRMKIYSLALVAASLASCQSNSTRQENNADSTENLVQSDTIQGQWIDLFDGQSLAGWHGFNKTEPVKNWEVQDGVLACTGKGNKEDFGGDIVSDQEFGNFELEWEWKIAKGGNSGVMYHVIEDPKYKAPYETGPEYQMIDDIGFPQKLEEWQMTGANYAMNLADSSQKVLKPVGEWNSSKIIYNNGHVEHWLNGKKIVDFQEGTEEWKKEKSEGKWKDYPDYKITNRGKIALQDHGDSAWFRNIRIRNL
ncbi:3-keto-disaccharide hydrolase, partial [Olivibacter sitiensis]|uniref:3-keto-disaccharide hydrolase n=1 Tax=Olivibacter sitiensis TaxID=376470 RepID=UPI0004194BFE